MAAILLLFALLTGTAEAEPISSDSAQTVFSSVERFDGVVLEVEGGVARLSGEVPNPESRAEAAQLAARVEGVIFVDNQIQVEADLEPSAEEVVDDASIEEQITRIVRQVAAFESIQVEVDSGVVHLQGSTFDPELVQKLKEVAEGVEGVVYVDNEVAVTTSLRERLRPAAENAWDKVEALVARLPLMVAGLLIIAVFFWLGRRLAAWKGLLRHVSDQPFVRTTVGRVLQSVLVVIGILMALELVGATSLVGAVVGTAGVLGLAVGFAFQDIVENYLAGLLLAVQQPFSQDDVIEVDGVKGVVVKLTTRNTLLLTFEGNHVYLPNANVFKGQVTNFTRNPQRRFSFDVGVGVEEDLRAVFETGVATLVAMEGVADEPAPSLQIKELGDSSVVVTVHGWVDQLEHSYLAVRTDAIRRIKEAFEDAGYDLPEPIYRVTLKNVAPSAPRKAAPRDPARTSDEPALSLSAERHLERQTAVERARVDEGQDLLADK